MAETSNKADSDTVEGTIDEVIYWKSDKGYFLNLNGNSNDFYGFGKCKFNIGDEVIISVKEGTGAFSDKAQITKIQKYDQAIIKAQPARKSQEPPGIPQVKDAGNVYVSNQQLIVQQCCLKAAANIVKESVPREGPIKWGKIIETTIRLKDSFFRDILELEGKPEDADEDADDP